MCYNDESCVIQKNYLNKADETKMHSYINPLLQSSVNVITVHQNQLRYHHHHHQNEKAEVSFLVIRPYLPLVLVGIKFLIVNKSYRNC